MAEALDVNKEEINENVNSKKPKYQWGRYAEVIIKDFQNGRESTIPNDLEIEFDFFKSVDDSTQNSTGTIKIKGLTEERCQSFTESGGEVILNCGYKNNVVQLFRAYIVRLTWEYSDNATLTTIECSMNLQEYYISTTPKNTNADGVSSSSITLNALLRNYSRACGFADVLYFSSFDMNQQEKQECEDLFNRVSFAYEFVGTADDALNALCATFVLIRETRITDTGTVLMLTASKQSLERVRNDGFSKISKDESLKSAQEYANIRWHYEASYTNELTTATILSKETGLISSKVEYKIAKAYRDQTLLVTDQETFKSQQKTEKFITNEKKRKSKYDKKTDERKSKGLKELKPFKYKTVKNEIQVNRKYIKVLALLNPVVKPQSPIIIVKRGYTDTGVITEDALLGRARSVTYKGNNKTGDWFMELYVETSPENDSELTPDQQQQLQSAQEDGQSYSKNPNQASSQHSDSQSNAPYSPTSGTMTKSEIQALGMKTPISAGAITAPVKSDTVGAMQVLDAHGLDGQVSQFTSITGGNHSQNGKFRHDNGHKFDLDLKCNDLECYKRTRNLAYDVLTKAGYKVVIWSEAPQWGWDKPNHVRPYGTGSHLDVQVLGRL